MFSRATRTAVAAVATGAVLALTACGDGDDAATVTTISIRPESYALKPPATAPPTAPAIPVADADGTTQSEQSYTIHEDEYPFEIAALFEVDLDALRKFNGWDTDYSNFPGPGGTARIPPGAKFLDPTATTTTTAPDTTDTDTGTATTTEGGSCTQGTHELEEGDYPVDVAKKYDVTVDALLAANGWAMDASGNVPQWPAVGTKVNIPVAPDCAGTATATTAAAG